MSDEGDIIRKALTEMAETIEGEWPGPCDIDDELDALTRLEAEVVRLRAQVEAQAERIASVRAAWVVEGERVVRLREALREAVQLAKGYANLDEQLDGEALERWEAVEAALREEVSEPASASGVDPGSVRPPDTSTVTGSLTSPVDHGIDACFNNGWEDAPSWKLVCACGWETWDQGTEEYVRARHAQHVAALTSPVDTTPRRIRESGPWGWISEPRGYVEHGPGGPRAVYHAETSDAYLQHGDTP